MSLTHAMPSDSPPPRVPKASRLLFRMHRAQFLIASCAPVLLDFGVPDVRTILWIQTYCTKFFYSLLLNELLNLSRKFAVVRDCNEALIVNFARADQSFVDVCLPTLESHSIPVLSRSMYAQASAVGN